MSSAVKYQRTLFEPEHELFRESYRGFLDRHVAPYHDEWEKAKIVDRGVWLEAGKQGFLGMAVPEEYGGGGNPDFRYNTIITEETTAGRYSGIGFGLHNDIVAPYLLALATEEQKQRWLPKFCTGELITAIAMTEPGTGSDLQGIKTRAVKQGDHYVLNGSKTFITNGINSDLVIVVAQTDPDKGRARLFAARRRTRHGGLRTRPPSGQDRPGRAGHRRAVVHRRAGSGRKPARRGGHGVHLPDAEPAAGTDHRSPSWRPRRWSRCWSRRCNTPRSARRLASRSAASRTAASCWPSWRPRPPWCA